MATTAFYQWPYPLKTDTVDIPRDIKALADKLETMKVGFIIPSGDLTLGQATVESQKSVYLRTLDGANQMEGRLYVMGGGMLAFALTKNGTEIGRLRLNQDGTIGLGSGSAYSQLPYAYWLNQRAVTLAASPVSVAFTFPAGRFAHAPQTFINVQTSAWFGNLSGVTTGGATILLRHYDNVAGTGQVQVDLLAMNMTPAASEGRAALREMIPEGFAPYTVTCATPPDVCMNGGVPIDMLLYVESGTPTSVTCGVCDQLITDVVPVTPTGRSKKGK